MNQVKGIVQQGYRVASGLTDNSPYPAGTIELQIPHFLALGLDLRNCYPGTLNVNIAPQQLQILEATHRFKDVVWLAGFDPETFSFCHCTVQFAQQNYEGWIYYPHPETKINHEQPATLVEILASHIPGIAYGDEVWLMTRKAEVRMA
jgi:CTP-dependent riboflavin kinase